MVTRRTYLQMMAGAGATVALAGYAHNTREDEDPVLEDIEDGDRVHRDDLPSDLAYDLDVAEVNMNRSLRGRERSTINRDTATIDFYRHPDARPVDDDRGEDDRHHEYCDDISDNEEDEREDVPGRWPDNEHIYLIDVSVETHPESSFTSINDYLEEDRTDVIEKRLAPAYGSMLYPVMNHLGDYRAGPDRDAAIVGMAAEIRGAEDGRLIATFDEDGFEEAADAAAREVKDVSREELYRMAQDRMEIEET